MNENMNQLFNTPIEISLRVLLILSINKGEIFDIERLTYFDYICTRLSDYNSNYSSLHPKNPYRKCEISIKRPLIKNALLILIKKDLVKVIYNNKGIQFIANNYSENFILQFKSFYSNELKSHIIIGSKLLNNKSNLELKEFFLDFTRNFEIDYRYENILRGEH